MAEPIVPSVPEGSPEPRVRITRSFPSPFASILTSARTCRSPRGVVRDEDLKPGGESLARELLAAGHHTTFEHAYFQFSLENVSRHFLWSFLHAHPFYNSEQVSQRYVKVRESSCFVPPIHGEALSAYREGLHEQHGFYKELIEKLLPGAEAAYHARFPSRARKAGKHEREIERKAQEIARYVLPVATCSHLYHTVSALTLLRYFRMCGQYDAPYEQRLVVGTMVRALLDLDPAYGSLLEEPIPTEDTPEARFLAGRPELADPPSRRAFLEEFDSSLGGKVSRLVDWKSRGEKETAETVREVLGVPAPALPDDDAIALAISPSRNPILANTLNLTTLDKLTRAMHHSAYTFRKKLSHTADSQDQRHRTTPASRPVLAAHSTGDPDFITPILIRQDPAIETRYREMMDRIWERIRRIERLGASEEFALYLLPNAVAVRFTESADFQGLRHKHVMRLCYLAQEEIWQASIDEALQVREVHPRLGRSLGPPCVVRKEAGIMPWCPEGARFCGEPVWDYDIRDYHRVI